MIKINFINLTTKKFEESFFINIAKFVLRLFKIEKELNIIVVGENKIRALNRKYRKKNKVTDVLSFPYERGLIGEVFLCPAYSKKLAKREKIDETFRLKKILIHGILHLLGYKDNNEKDYQIMNQETEKILKMIK